MQKRMLHKAKSDNIECKGKISLKIETISCLVKCFIKKVMIVRKITNNK
jgi:hypothetical protein